MTTIADIKAAVAAEFGIRVEEMDGDRTARPVAQARQIAMYLARQMTAASYGVIRREMGYRDHGTAVYAARVIPDRMRRDPALAARIARIRDALHDGHGAAAAETTAAAAAVLAEIRTAMDVMVAEIDIALARDPAGTLARFFATLAPREGGDG